jgi:hypothetical protein
LSVIALYGNRKLREVLLTASCCCKKVRPENAARLFHNPASILLNSVVVGMLSTETTILEIGAGCLRNALYLIKKGHSVSVLEVPGVRERFREQYDEFERRGGRVMFALPLRAKFDVIVSTFVVETICNRQQRVGLLMGVYKSLSVTGALVLSARGPRDLLTAHNDGIRCGDGYVTPNLSFARSYNRPQMERLLRNVGFTSLEFLHKKSSKEPEYLHVVARRTDG